VREAAGWCWLRLGREEEEDIGKEKKKEIMIFKTATRGNFYGYLLLLFLPYEYFCHPCTCYFMCALSLSNWLFNLSQLLGNLATTGNGGLEVFPLSNWLYVLFFGYINKINIRIN
jgi:hypothetical protein